MAVEAVFGARTAFVSDIDTGPCKILAHRYPNTPNLGDIRNIDWTPWAGKIDILEGGSPCTDLSTAGRRAGMAEGTQSNLWVMMREAIAHLRPRYVIWENVRGAYSATATSAMESDPGLLGDHPAGVPALRALGRVLGDLADLGYDARWCGLRAADVGAPHGRFRVFLLATPADADQPRLEGFADEAGAAQAGRYGHAEPSLGGPDLKLLPTPKATNNETRQDESHGGDRGNFHGLLTGQVDWLEYAPAIARWEQVLGRPCPPPTMIGRKGQPQLSPRLTEWMMGLPAGWITDVPGITRNEALKACGNGVVPAQAAAALRHMIGADTR